MHEFSLAQGLFKQLLQLADTHQAHKIIRVQVEVGRLSGIVVDSFSFGFEILAQENKLTRTAVLAITETEPDYHCLDCGTVYTPDKADSIQCPQCSSASYTMSGGDDLILTQVEME